MAPAHQIIEGQTAGESLSQHRGQSNPLDAHGTGKEENRVKNHIENGSGQENPAGKLGAAVGPDKMGHGHGENGKGQPHTDDPGVRDRINHHGLCGAEEVEHRLQKGHSQHRQQAAQPHRQHNGVAPILSGGAFLLLSQVKAESRRAAHADEGRQGGG